MLLQANPNLVHTFQVAEADRDRAKRLLEEDALKSAPWEKGNVIRDKNTGARYRIDKVSAWARGAEVNLSLQATRVYTTGRRPARASTTIMYSNDYELVVDGAKTPG